MTDLKDKKRESLSAVLMVKNGEKRIKDCLESVKWADEIIVVDGMSTDKTVDISKGYTDKVYVHEFDGNFDHERQFAADQANCDWVLHLDVDEVISENMKKEIDKILIGERDFKYVAYKFKRKNYFLGHYMEYGGWHSYYFNLFKRGHAHYDGRVHHLLVADGEIGAIDADVLHFPVDDLHEYVERHNRYTTLEAEELVAKRGVISEKELRRHLVIKPLKFFWKTYVRKKAYKEGLYGLVFAIYFSFYDFLRWAKYWQRVRSEYEKK
jgi:glycosyltransferase involved in cell wall biosynthesis